MRSLNQLLNAFLSLEYVPQSIVSFHF